MCDLREKWETFMEMGEEHIEDGRQCLEPDDEDDGTEKETEIDLRGTVILDKVEVSPFLSSSGKNIGDALYLDTWFDGLSVNAFYSCWKRNEQRIKALVRYPGGYHEWLMVSTLPELKAMGIPMELIRTLIVPTSQCCFYVDGEECRHGESGSGRMHRDLFKAIVMAYYEETAFGGDTCIRRDGTVDYEQKLRLNLFAFATVYFPEECQYIPDELAEFLDIAEYQGE